MNACIGEGNGNPLQCSCLENPRDGGAWWAAVYGVTQSQTRLKRLSMVLRKEEYTPGLTAIRLEPLPKMNPRELRMWKMEGSWPQDRWDAWTEWFQWTQTLAPSHTEQSANFLPWDIWFSLLHKNTFEVPTTCLYCKLLYNLTPPLPPPPSSLEHFSQGDLKYCLLNSHQIKHNSQHLGCGTFLQVDSQQ